MIIHNYADFLPFVVCTFAPEDIEIIIVYLPDVCIRGNGFTIRQDCLIISIERIDFDSDWICFGDEIIINLNVSCSVIETVWSASGLVQDTYFGFFIEQRSDAFAGVDIDFNNIGGFV